MALNNSQYDQIMRHYQELLLARNHTITERKTEVYTAIPQLKEIDAAISSAGVASAMKRLSMEDPEQINEEARLLSKTIASLTEKKASLIKQAGYPDNYLEPDYECADCKDTGYIDGAPCHCFTQAALDITYNQSNLRKILNQENFKNFNLSFYSDEIKNERGVSSRDNARNVFDTSLEYVNTFDSKHGNLLLYGNTGTGKTFLTHCIAKEILDKGYSVIYLSSTSFFEVFENKTFGKGNDISTYDNIFSCDLLIIDDLGTELGNSFTNSNLFLCINQRLLLDKATIISTNLSVKQLGDQYSERVFSRIYSNFKFVRLFGNDIRVLKKTLTFTSEGVN